MGPSTFTVIAGAPAPIKIETLEQYLTILNTESVTGPGPDRRLGSDLDRALPI